MAVNPFPIEELQYAFLSNRLENQYDIFLKLLKTITIIPSLFFKLNVGILETGKKFKANLFNTAYPEFKYSSWWSNLIFRSNISHFDPIIVS